MLLPVYFLCLLNEQKKERKEGKVETEGCKSWIGVKKTAWNNKKLSRWNTTSWTAGWPNESVLVWERPELMWE